MSSNSLVLLSVGATWVGVQSHAHLGLNPCHGAEARGPVAIALRAVINGYSHPGSEGGLVTFSRRRLALLALTSAYVVLGAVCALVGHTQVAIALMIVLLGAVVFVLVDVRGTIVAARRQLQQVADRQRRGDKLLRDVRNMVRPISRELPHLARVESLDVHERRYLAAFEAERLAAADRHRELARLVPRSAEIRRLLVDATRDVEALLQLLPRVPNRPLLPPSGHFAMDPRALAHLADIVERERPRTVLECGSGTSTIYLGHLLANPGSRIVSIDHLEEYAQATRVHVTRHCLESVVEVRHVPLAPVPHAPTASWYDVEGFADLDEIDLLVVDGPPASTGEEARRYALELLRERLRSGAVVVLDDATREDERHIVERWKADYGLVEEDQGVSRLAVLRVPENSDANARIE